MSFDAPYRLLRNFPVAAGLSSIDPAVLSDRKKPSGLRVEDAVGDLRGSGDLDALGIRQALGRSIRKDSVGLDPPSIDSGVVSYDEDRFQSRVEPTSSRSGTAWEALD